MMSVELGMAKEIFGSNLLLQNKLVRASAPNSSELAGEISGTRFARPIKKLVFCLKLGFWSPY
ncbi:hypothetical protein A2118_03765 [Candidatus Kaiserbacteria bacterium GWA2_50_9]|uniref:Uncharacterized protein n=1 Tax=Candidatus Kaiserbacteria bacterium GWA2_50_9 TaxID=1798474 RepID=A0A1F6BTJ6_9BACT|nr:MAG: hypothetical protein A2118_03765 [Candidatus Kaiserbacteria bacterium GWA2_50_9]